MKSRKVKATAKTKAFMSKKKLKGNIPLESYNDSDADVDSDDLIRDDKDNELSTDEENDGLIREDEDISEEEEVLPITDDDDEEDMDESEVDEEAGLPNPEAWGKKKSMYYNADFVDEDRGRTYREEDAERAKAEEEEALAIQRSLANYVHRDVKELHQLDNVESVPDEESDEESRFDSLTQDQKIKLLKKKYPELLVYRNEFKEKINEIRDRIYPLVELFETGNYPNETTKKYIDAKYLLYLQYLMNISFYFYLKSKGTLGSNHPVKERIADFKRLLDRINNVPVGVNEALDNIVQRLRKNEDIKFSSVEQEIDQVQPQAESNIQSVETTSQMNVTADKLGKKKEKKSKSKQFDTETEKEIVSLYMDGKSQQKEINTDIPEEKMDEDPDVPEEAGIEEKRKITYQIAKNKGLVPKRKKEYRNPRVHHRMKFKKAKIRRKGQVREVVREIKRYAGEPTGISAHVVRSVKYK